jgi:subtilisin family serine protease
MTTNRERNLLVAVLVLTALSGFIYFRGRSHEVTLKPNPEDESRLLTSQSSPEPRHMAPELLIAEYRKDQIIVGFKVGASPADKEKVHRMLGASRSEIIKSASGGSHLLSTGSSGQGEIDLITISSETKSQTPSSGRSRPDMYISPEALDTPVGIVSDELDLASRINKIKSYESVAFAQPNYLYRLAASTPNDDFYRSGRLWNMYSNAGSINSGSISNSFGSQADTAWAMGHTGSRTVYIGVIDSGIDMTHPDLAANVDTRDAIDLARDSQKPTDLPFVNKDEIGHGTHVAGIIGAIGNNKIGVVGMNWQIEMIPVKVVSAVGDESIDDPTAIRAFDYLTHLKQEGINIVAANASWGGPGIQDKNGNYIEDYALLHSIKSAARAGILCVASAGNAHDGYPPNDNDAIPMYPSSLDSRDSKDGTSSLSYNAVISVAAIDQYGAIAGFSYFGAKSVALGAPGVGILSTMPAVSQMTNSNAIQSTDGSTYETESGTSAAAPHVTGAIALYVADHPAVSPQDVVTALLQSVIATPSLKGKTLTGGRLDASKF